MLVGCTWQTVDTWWRTTAGIAWSRSSGLVAGCACALDVVAAPRLPGPRGKQAASANAQTVLGDVCCTVVPPRPIGAQARSGRGERSGIESVGTLRKGLSGRRAVASDGIDLRQGEMADPVRLTTGHAQHAQQVLGHRVGGLLDIPVGLVMQQLAQGQ